MPAPRPTYAEDVHHWRRYLELYPPELRDLGGVVEEYWSWRGIDVHVDRIPAPEAGLTVVIAHGGGGYGRMFLPFARLIVGDSAEIVAPDLPGYGLTRPNAPVPYAAWPECLADLVRHEQRRSPRPVVLVGASMGGLVAYDVAATVPGIAGLVVTCLLDPRDVSARRAMTRLPWMGAGAPGLMRVLPGVADRVRFPLKWLATMSAISNDPRLSAAVAADPSGGGNRVSVRFLRTFMTSAPAVEPEEFTACPVLLVHPGADAWTPTEISRRFAERIAAPTEIVELENAGHIPVEQPGLGQLVDAVGRFLAHRVST